MGNYNILSRKDEKGTYPPEMKIWVTSLEKDPRPCDVLAEGESIIENGLAFSIILKKLTSEKE